MSDNINSNIFMNSWIVFDVREVWYILAFNYVAIFLRSILDITIPPNIVTKNPLPANKRRSYKLTMAIKIAADSLKLSTKTQIRETFRERRNVETCMHLLILAFLLIVCLG